MGLPLPTDENAESEPPHDGRACSESRFVRHCRMPDTPWLGDACSLVDAFRAGERSPAEELDACLAAMGARELTGFSYLDAEGARARAAAADTSLPFGGVPVAVKELDYVEGWPSTEASLGSMDRIADHYSPMVKRLKAAGG